MAAPADLAPTFKAVRIIVAFLRFCAWQTNYVTLARSANLLAHEKIADEGEGVEVGWRQDEGSATLETEVAFFNS
jgi:hypothetical protein